jgi:hypothetical protein
MEKYPYKASCCIDIIVVGLKNMFNDPPRPDMPFPFPLDPDDPDDDE